MRSPATQEFADFAQRFVANYWRDIALGGTDHFPGSEPCRQTPEELLSEVEFDTWCEPGLTGPYATCFMLQMVGKYLDAWTFTFHESHPGWSLAAATSGSKSKPAQTDLLDGCYSRWFRPFLERITDDSI